MKLKIVILCIVSFLTYAQTIFFDFTFDDKPRVVKSDYSNFFEVFTTPSWPGDLYRPVTDLSFYLTKIFLGLEPVYFHAGNIFLHLIAVCLAFIFLSRYFEINLSFFASLIFALHPLNSEVVSNVSYRGEILAFIFGISGIIFFLNSKIIHFYLSGIFFILSSLSKESGLTFLILAIFSDYFFNKKIELKKVFFILILFSLSLSFRYYALGRITSDNSATGYIDNFLFYESTLIRVITALMILPKYIYHFIFPLNISPDYSYAQIAELSKWSFFELIFSICAWVIIIYFIIVGGVLSLKNFYHNDLQNDKKISIAFYAICFFLFSLLITSNILFPIGTIFALRLAYSASLGLSLLVSIFLFQVTLPKLKYILPVILVLMTVYYSSFWKNNDYLMDQMTAASPKSVRAWHARAASAFNYKAYDECIKAEKNALNLKPDFMPSLFMLQRAYFQQNNFVEALKVIEQIGEKDKGSYYYEALAWVNLKVNQIENAKVNFYKAIELDKNNPSAYIGIYAVSILENNLDFALLIEKQFSEGQLKDQRYLEYRELLYK